MPRDFQNLQGLNAVTLNAATTAETSALLLAFAFAVAKTHPNPAALLTAFQEERRESAGHVASVAGADSPELAYAAEAAKEIGDVICRILINR